MSRILIILFILFLITGGMGYFFYILGEPVFLGLMSGMVYGFVPAVIVGGLLSAKILGGAPMERKYVKYLIPVSSAPYFLRNDKSCYSYWTEEGKGIIEKDLFNVEIRYTYGRPYVEYWDKVNDPLRIIGEEAPYYVIYLPKGSIILDM